jgi:hypothetical protein
MSKDSIPAIAAVECRSEGRAQETPVAIIWGDTRYEIVHVIDRAVITGVEAGEPVRQRFWVEVENGQRFKLLRVMPDGAWQVTVER